jgi:hypothetical protein
LGQASGQRRIAPVSYHYLPTLGNAGLATLSVIASVSEAIHGAARKKEWIASRSLSSGAHSRDPLARNDG